MGAFGSHAEGCCLQVVVELSLQQSIGRWKECPVTLELKGVVYLIVVLNGPHMHMPFYIRSLAIVAVVCISCKMSITYHPIPYHPRKKSCMHAR